MTFLQIWHEAAVTSLGLFWMAFWAFGLGYLISSLIQVFVTRERMRKTMGKAGPKSIFYGTFFGFISSSCSFAALATTRALFTKGAGLISSLAFLLASTNLVIELGIVIAVFLSWQFVVGEYIGGIILIILMAALVKFTYPKKLVEKAREHAREETGEHEEGSEVPDWKKEIFTLRGWIKVAMRYGMEWQMVWKDVTIGFTVAGIIAAFVPRSFFQALFVGSGSEDPDFWQILVQTFVGPVAAFFTFIGSMGNIPLAAVLFANGVSFAGIMAFIFSDLVVFPVLRIQARYYGWKMAFYILGVFLAILVSTALIMHYGFSWAGVLPDPGQVQSVTERSHFQIDYTFFLNLIFIAMSAFFVFLSRKGRGHKHEMAKRPSERILFWLAAACYGWLLAGVACIAISIS
jgi:hypothetical protein